MESFTLIVQSPSGKLPTPESRPRAPAPGSFRGGRGGGISSGLDRAGSGRGSFPARPLSGGLSSILPVQSLEFVQRIVFDVLAFVTKYQ
jgi:hypothetical protein